MLQGRPRELLKGLLIQSRIKFVYDRITDTRYTRFYFILSGFTCLLLCALQGVILSDSAKAVEILTAAVEEADPPPHITILKDGELQVCDRIPDRRDASCIVLWLKDREASQSSGLSRREKRRLRRRQARPPNSSDSEDDNSNSGQSDGSNSNGQSSNSDSQSSDDERGLNAPKQAAPRVSTNSTGKLRPSSTVNTTAPRASTTVLRLNRKDTVRRRQVKGSKVGSSDGSNSDGQNSNDSQSDRNSSSGRRPSRTSTRTSTATASTTATQPTATVLKLKREDTLATLAASARKTSLTATKTATPTSSALQLDAKKVKRSLRRRQGQPPNSSSASEGDSPSGESDGNESVSSDDELAEAPPPPPPASTTSTTTVASSTSTSPSSSSSSTSSSTLSTVSTTTTRTSSASAPASSSSTTSTSTSTVPPSTTTSVTVSSTTSVTVSSSTTANGSTTVTISSSSSTAFPQSSSTFTATTAPSSSGSVSTASTASTKSTVTPSGSTSTTPATLSSSTDAATTSSQSTSTRATSSPSATTSASGTTTTGTSSTKGTPTSTSTTTEITGISLNQSSGVSPHSMSCIYSMSWLEEVLHDSQREDVALFFFELWLFGLGLAAILNESLPHLGAAFFGRVLAGAWASSRIHSAKALAAFYRNSIVASPCQGADLLGSLWEVRLAHTVPVVAFNIVGLVSLGFFSWKLTKVYANVTFTRLGLSISLQKMYMLVLFFSVCLQLGSFFTAASMGLWIAKVGHGSFKALSQHLPLYLAAFVAVLVLVIPWFILGWKSVRNESRKRFGAYLALSMFLLGISGIMFSRDTYRTIFLSWSFFATITVTAFVLLVFAVITGLACFLNFGKGLSAYLQSNEKLEGEDFTPIYGEKRATMRRTMKPYPFVPFISEKTDPEWSAAKLQEARSNPKLAPVQTPSMKSSIRRAASRVQSAWSAYSADGVNAKGPPPLPKNLHLQVPPSTLLPNGRVPSGVSSIVPFQGLPFPPPSSIREAASPTVPTSGRDSIGSLIERLSPVSVPMTPQPYLPSRASSIRSIRQSPFPTIPVLNLPSRASSIRSIRKPPFNSTAPITNRQSGATSIMDNYLNPFQSAPSSARESMVSFVTSTTQEVSHSRGSPDIREVQRDVV